MAKIINSDNFNDTIKKWVVLIDFWAEWCGPCQTMLPILDEFSKEMEWKMIVWKINVDDNPELSTTYWVMSIPTILIFKDWEVVKTLVWVHQWYQLKEECEKFL